MTKCHAIVSFSQSTWLKGYIDLNTRLRQQATTKDRKDTCKLQNNSCFGKTIENPRKYQDVHLVMEPKKFRRLVNSPFYKSSMKVDENLAFVNMVIPNVKLDKVVAAGFSILEYAKLHMYKFYDQMREFYGDRIKVLMTDTDSFIFEIQTDDVYVDLKQMDNEMDFSEYPRDHFCYSAKNMKVLGKFKDENFSKPIKEFVGIRPKMYSILEYNDNQKKTHKGVPHKVEGLSHEEYKRVLFEDTISHATFYTIQSKNHQLETKKITKKALENYDDKRFLLEDGISSRPYNDYDGNELAHFYL